MHKCNSTLVVGFLCYQIRCSIHSYFSIICRVCRKILEYKLKLRLFSFLSLCLSLFFLMFKVAKYPFWIRARAKETIKKKMFVHKICCFLENIFSFSFFFIYTKIVIIVKWFRKYSLKSKRKRQSIKFYWNPCKKRANSIGTKEEAYDTTITLQKMLIQRVWIKEEVQFFLSLYLS